MNDRDSLAAGLSRRELLALLGMGTGLSLVPLWKSGANLSAAAGQAGAARVTFPRGAIIRTLFRDIPPDQLGDGPLLFHEHLSIDLPQFGPRPANAPPPQPPP